ncbi:MAG TPA: hypothetical protein VNX68_02870, partial [Nitrosopumilaceae archaeon]|nr:hypothetical protein [Nitrosopumilaceae archaeon]
SPTWNNLNANNTIIGKYFKDEKTAYRAIVRIGFNSNTTRAQIADASVTTAPTYPTVPAMKEDKWKSSNNFVGLGAGYEMRRGKTRLQGFYGADAMIWMSSNKDVFTYGNSLVAGGSAPVGVGSSTDFGATANNLTGVKDTYGNAARVTTRKSGTSIGFGVRAFIGAEYFIFPKISIGGEFGWGLGLLTGGKSSTTTESIGGTGPSVGTQTITGSKSPGYFILDTDKNAFGTANAQLRLNLHF